jgi:hypothetical protein
MFGARLEFAEVAEGLIPCDSKLGLHWKLLDASERAASSLSRPVWNESAPQLLEDTGFFAIQGFTPLGTASGTGDEPETYNL